MGIFRKLAFWKKQDLDSPDLDSGFDKEFGTLPDQTPGLGGSSFEQLPDSSESQFQNEETITDPRVASQFNQENRPNRSLEPSPLQRYSGGSPMEKDLELLSSKLDAIKALVDNMNQRLENIERMQKESQYKRW
jgi:hypothetical protein